MSSNLVPSPYQLVALSKLRSNGFSALLVCDGVGVGKTISAGYAIALHHLILNDPVIVVCPPVLIAKWTTELRDKFGIRTVVVRAPDQVENTWDEIRERSDRPHRVYILPYSLLSRIVIDNPPAVGLLVFDEVHNVRNPEAKSHASAMNLARAATWRLGLTATPIHNDLGDLTSELSVLLPSLTKVVIDSVVSEAWRTKRTRILHPWTTRFTKERLAIHFTSRNISRVAIRYPLEYTENVERCLSTWGQGAKRSLPASRLETITRFRMAASSPDAFYSSMKSKVPSGLINSKLDALRELLDASPTERWLVFCEFVETAKAVARGLPNRTVLLLTGETPPDLRQATIEQFLSSESSVLVLTNIGSEGLDLQTCSALVNYDLHWNPMVLEQRIGRIDRIGQEKHQVRIVNFVVDGSIDERVIQVLSRKLRLVANTFADPGKVLSGPSRTLAGPQSGRLEPPDDQLLGEELIEANELIDGIAMTNELPAEDYELLAHLSPHACRIEEWPRGRERWVGPPPWIQGAHGSADWLNGLSSSSLTLRQLLSEYGG